MLRNDIKIRSSEGPEFDCYLVTPKDGRKVPAIVLASASHGVDQDLRAIADAFAEIGSRQCAFPPASTASTRSTNFCWSQAQG